MAWLGFSCESGWGSDLLGFGRMTWPGRGTGLTGAGARDVKMVTEGYRGIPWVSVRLL